MRPLSFVPVLAAVLVVSGCGTAARQPRGGPSPAARPGSEAVARARSLGDSLRHPYTAADVDFMTRMIGHHAQAIVMSRLAPTNGASPSVRTLAERIINAQEDEIALMQQWLRDRGQAVPDPAAMSGHMDHAGGSEHAAMMPGMLTSTELTQLAGARGADFDRLFLNFMIRHHRGAVTMVQELIATPGAAQDQSVFKLASDVNVDQTTEVERMTSMLAAILFQRPPA